MGVGMLAAAATGPQPAVRTLHLSVVVVAEDATQHRSTASYSTPRTVARPLHSVSQRTVVEVVVEHAEARGSLATRPVAVLVTVLA
jgi:hypothetical protein